MKNISTVTRDLDVTRKVDVDAKMDKVNPTGTGYSSLNRKANTTVGVYSTTNGLDCTASGKWSYAEGRNTISTNDATHAEGYNTQATAYQAHAEGYGTQATGQYSHAQGFQTKASGKYSHAGGISCTASGTHSFVHGDNCTASGNYSMALCYGTKATESGSYAFGDGVVSSGHLSYGIGQGTLANHQAQFSFGKYNVADPSTAATGTIGNYIEIVGNGTSDTARSNARTLDWSGNEVLAGKSTASEFVHSGTGTTLMSVLNDDDTTDYMLTYQNSTLEVGNLGKGVKLMGNATRPKYETSTTVDGGVDLALYSDTSDKLTASNIKAGSNITLSTSGNNVTISAATGSGGTNVYVNSVKQDTVNFDSDPQTQIGNKMDKANPTGTGSFSLNRKSGTTVGSYSVAEGHDCTASGYSSHAEGFDCTASGSCSHAEGSTTIASSPYSHAEGWGTVAQRLAQHVFGAYNVPDSSGSTTAQLGKYVEIVGNGDNTNALSNARTLDWDGNEVLAGTITINGSGTISYNASTDTFSI